MPPSIHIVTRYASSYNLLSAMAAELVEAASSAGFSLGGDTPPETVLWMNHLSDLAAVMNAARPALPRAAGQPAGPAPALVQFFVDHPLALQVDQMDRLAQAPTFRLVLPCLDGAHLLRMRWPRLRHAHCLHAISPAALCDAGDIEPTHTGPPGSTTRDIDVVVTGSIHSHDQILRLYSTLPPWLQPSVRAMVDHLFAQPAATFENAAELVLGPCGVDAGDWRVLAASWRVCIADLNRRRRLAMLRALSGLSVAVYGSDAWREECTGTLSYRGAVEYAELPALLRRAKACLAWGPTQFTTCFSERLLLALAAGCAVVTEDRAMTRRHFAAPGAEPSLRLFDPSRPGLAAEELSALLADPARRVELAQRGRREVERTHLWSHRLKTLIAATVEPLSLAA